MNDEPNFGLSADRIRQLLECKPAEGYKMPRWEDKVKASKPAPKPKAKKAVVAEEEESDEDLDDSWM